MNFKHILAATILLFGFSALAVVSNAATVSNVAVVSEGDNPEMTKIFYEVEVDASKDRAWEVLADFANLSWTETVTNAHYINDKQAEVGAARHCDLPDDAYIVERITQWEEGRKLAYVIDDASDPITTDSYVIWRVTGDNNSSKVSFEAQYELKYGLIGDLMNVLMVKDRFSSQITHFMGEYKTYVESQS